MALSNIYEAGAADVIELFGDFMEGDSSRIALALSATPLGNDAHTAIEKSLEAFGYGETPCSFASLVPYDREAEGGDATLDPQSIFLLTEALDPLLLIVADEKTARLVAQAYRTAFDLDAPTRIFGRPTVIFQDLESLMGTDDGRQKAWSLLKTLPKR